MRIEIELTDDEVAKLRALNQKVDGPWELSELFPVLDGFYQIQSSVMTRIRLAVKAADAV